MSTDHNLVQDAQNQAVVFDQHQLDLADNDGEYDFDATGRPRTLVWRGDTNAAQQHRTRPKFQPHRDPKSDDTIELMARRREEYIADCIQAVYNLSDARDNPGAEGFILFGRGNPKTVPVRDVEAACRILVDRVIQQCKVGWTGHQEMDVTNNSKFNKLDRDGSCESRMQNVISALRDWKSICKDIVVSDASILNLANAPMSLSAARQSSQNGNKSKKRGKNNAKAAAEELARIKRQAIPGSARLSSGPTPTPRPTIAPSSNRIQDASQKASRARASRTIPAPSTRRHSAAQQAVTAPTPHHISVNVDSAPQVALQTHSPYAGTPSEFIDTPGLTSGDDPSPFDQDELCSPSTDARTQASGLPQPRKIAPPDCRGPGADYPEYLTSMPCASTSAVSEYPLATALDAHTSYAGSTFQVPHPSGRTPTSLEPAFRSFAPSTPMSAKIHEEKAVMSPGSPSYHKTHHVETCNSTDHIVTASQIPLEFSELPISLYANSTSQGKHSNGANATEILPITEPVQDEEVIQFDDTPDFDTSNLSFFDTMEQLRTSHTFLDDGSMPNGQRTVNSDFEPSPNHPYQGRYAATLAPSHEDVVSGAYIEEGNIALIVEQSRDEEPLRTMNVADVERLLSASENNPWGWKSQRGLKRGGTLDEDADEAERCKRSRFG